MKRVHGNFGGGVVSAWEERIWLDRREIACPALRVPDRRGGFARMFDSMRRFRSRMQLGPVGGDDWLQGNSGKQI